MEPLGNRFYRGRKSGTARNSRDSKLRRLPKPEFDITDAEKVEVKKVARDLLQKLKEAKLVLDWRKKQRTRADVYHTVKVVLDKLPRAYTPELYVQKCDSVYQHIYDSYLGKGKGVYEASPA